MDQTGRQCLPKVATGAGHVEIGVALRDLFREVCEVGKHENAFEELTLAGRADLGVTAGRLDEMTVGRRVQTDDGLAKLHVAGRT